eukprot:2949492-Pyramimonas_sp.AAC.1
MHLATHVALYLPSVHSKVGQLARAWSSAGRRAAKNHLGGVPLRVRSVACIGRDRVAYRVSQSSRRSASAEQ